MKNIKKLKAMLATEIEAREVYVEGFEAVKLLDELEKEKKGMESELKSLEKAYSKAQMRVDKANEEAARIETNYSERAVEAEEAIASNIQNSEKQISTIVDEAREEHKALQTKIKALNKTIKGKEDLAVKAEDMLANATKELDEVRSRLKSI